MTAQPGERMLSWLDEDDPNRGAVPFMPVDSVIELPPSAGEPPPGKKSRREKAPKPPKPPREKRWRRAKASQEKAASENPPRDVRPREDWPAPADAASGDEWLSTLRDPAPRQERAIPRPEWNTAPDPAPRDSAGHPGWAAAPDVALDEGWTTTPPLPEAAAAPADAATGEDWFTAGDAAPHDAGPRDLPDRTEWAGDPDPTPRGDWSASDEAPARTEWGAPAGPPSRPDWVASPDWDAPRQPDPRPDWVAAPVPAPEDAWPAPEPRDMPPPEVWPAPLDITPDDDLPEPGQKRRRPRVLRSARTERTPRTERTGRRRRPLIVLAVALTAAVVGAAVIAAGTAYRLVFDGGTPGAHTIAAPVGGRTQATLDLASGAATVTVRGADLGDDLFQVTTPDGDDAVPTATIQGDRTTVRLVSNSGAGASAVEVRLNSRVTWRLLFAGGAETQTVDLSGGRLAGLEMSAGATRLELTLPKPAGTVPIRLRGGLDQLLLHAPPGVHTRVKVAKGATTVNLDRLNRSRIAPDTTFTPNGWGQAKARYDVDAAEGIGTVKLDRR